MTKLPTTNRDGFKLVLAWFVDQNGGRQYGAKKRMADALGVSRQSVDNYEDSGVPAKFVRKLSEITGLTAQQIAPEFFS